jgi:hypothetical protein
VATTAAATPAIVPALRMDVSDLREAILPVIFTSLPLELCAAKNRFWMGMF